MEFLNPYWLFGLLGISVPIIIHLFNFRRYRKVYFTNLKYLKSIKNETRKQQKVRHLLVLISRILAISCLVLAFAKPYIPGPAGEQRSAMRYVSVYLDNSMSMQAVINGNRIFDLAKSRANSIVNAYGPSDRFQLVTNDFEGRHQHYYNRDEFNTLISEVDLSPAFRAIKDVRDRMSETIIPDGEAEVHQYIISDFQSSAYADGFGSIDTLNKVFLLPMTERTFPNVFVDSCWFESPYNHIGLQQSLSVRITNASDMDIEKIPLKLMVNGRQHALGAVDIAAWGSTVTDLPVDNNQAGIQWAVLTIQDYPVTWDDEMYLRWTVKQQIPVMAISDGDPGYYLSKILSNDSVFHYYQEQLKGTDYSKLNAADLVILDNIGSISSGLAAELTDFVASGGSLLIVPSVEADIVALSTLTSEFGMGVLLPFDTTGLTVTDFDASHKMFEGVFEELPENLDLPFVEGHFPLHSTTSDYREVIMNLQNGDPYLLYTSFNDGKVYLLTSPLGDEYGNLPRHAIWVPVLYRIAMLSRPDDMLFYIIGNDMRVNTDMELDQEDGQIFVRSMETEYEFIPSVSGTGITQKLLLYDRIHQAGHYGVFNEDKLVMGFSYNYDRMESDPRILNVGQLEELIDKQEAENIFIVNTPEGQMDQNLAQISHGRDLWKLFIWLSLFFLLAEILLLRLFRK